MAAISHEYGALIESLVAEAPPPPALGGAVREALRGIDARALLTFIRQDPRYSFVAYDFPRDVCAKPQEMAAWLLEHLVLELRDERSSPAGSTPA